MRLLILFLLVFATLSLKAQCSTKSGYTLTSKFHYGFIWNFSEEVSHLSNQHFPAIEINLSKQTRGGKPWQTEYKYPQVSYSLFYFIFDSNKPVGNSLVLLIHSGKYIYKAKRSNLQWKLGGGMAYVEKRYDVESNFKNNVISQRINFALNGQLNFNYQLCSKVLLNAGMGLMHISNGAMERPNFGINLPTIHVGVGFNLSNVENEYRRDSSSVAHQRKTYFHISPFIGFKEVYPVNGPKYLLGGMNVYSERRMNHKSGLNVGLDFSYDHSKKSEILMDTIAVRNIAINRSQAAIIVGHELYLNRLSLITQMGVYVFDPTHINKPFYQKVGLKYYFSEKIFIGVAMKMHLGIADWIEWGGGLRL